MRDKTFPMLANIILSLAPTLCPVAQGVSVSDPQVPSNGQAPWLAARRGEAKIDPKLRRMAVGGGSLPVFIVLRNQPHKRILDRLESATRLKREMLEARYSQLQSQNFPSESELPEVQADLEEVLTETRQAAFKEIAAEIGPEQDAMEGLLLRVGAKNIDRYSAINMLAADVPAVALEVLEAEPLVLEVAPIETHSIQLAVSVQSLGAPVFWNTGYTGSGQSVAVMDTGVKGSHPAFSGKSIASRVFLDPGGSYSCFADDSSSPEDKQGHGTHVAGIVISQGAPSCSACQGVAKGIATLYNFKTAYLDCNGEGKSPTKAALAALDWAVQQAPSVKIFNYSSGGEAQADDDILAWAFDYFADTYGLTFAVSAGNESRGPLGLWTYSEKVTSPGIGYNILTVAAMNTQGTVDRSDDRVATFSSRGPTPGGRKKPDLAAPGGLRDDFWGRPVEGIYSACFSSDGFVAMPGTSMAAPHIAGAAALLRSAGIQNPLSIKALLLNTTDWLDWGKDQGWGYTNLGRTFLQRNNVVNSSIRFSSYRLYRGTANGLFYSTLTWNRMVTSSWCLSNLDLGIYSGASNARLASSVSLIDNVEKAYANISGPVVVKVAYGGAYCRSPEPFGLAFSDGGFVSATGPSLNVSCTGPAQVLPGAVFNVSCTARNTGDVAAFATKGGLNWLGGSGGAVQSYGDLTPAAAFTRSWSVTAPSAAGSHTLQADLSGSAFDEPFSTASTLTFSVSPPAAPAIGLSKLQLNFSFNLGGPLPAAETVNVSIVGSSAHSWTATSTAAWLVVSPSSGTAPSTISVSASPRDLRVGTYNGTVTISAAGLAAQTISVTLRVTANPIITSLVNGASFRSGVAPSSWVSIFGINLAPTTRLWRDNEIISGKLPTQLDGVSVTVNNRSAAVCYINPAQLNVQVPDDISAGAVQVSATTPQGTTTTIALMQQFAPGLFAFDTETRRYVAAQHSADFAIVGKPGLYPASVPAKPGEVIILYGTGFGPTNPPIPAGQVVRTAAPLANQVTIRIGNIPADLLWAGMSGAGLYQFNVKVPDNLPDGDALVVAEIGGMRTQDGTFVTVAR